MGTLHEQPPRPYLELGAINKTANEIRDRSDELSEYESWQLALKIHQSGLDQQNRDVWDEQISGITRELVGAVNDGFQYILGVLQREE